MEYDWSAVEKKESKKKVGFGFEAFSLSFCPAQGKNNSACCDVNQCSFVYQTTNMNIVPYITLRVSNGNFFNITANNIQASLQYSTSTVASVNVTMTFGPQTSQDYRVYLKWDNTLPASTMKQIVCQLSKANSNIITMIVNVKIQSVQYFSSQLAFPSRSDQFSTSVDACGATGCLVDTNYQASLCQ
nr:unnamed protein product [Naegleria fowleri]